MKFYIFDFFYVRMYIQCMILCLWNLFIEDTSGEGSVHLYCGTCTLRTLLEKGQFIYTVEPVHWGHFWRRVSSSILWNLYTEDTSGEGSVHLYCGTCTLRTLLEKGQFIYTVEPVHWGHFWRRVSSSILWNLYTEDTSGVGLVHLYCGTCTQRTLLEKGQFIYTVEPVHLLKVLSSFPAQFSISVIIQIEWTEVCARAWPHCGQLVRPLWSTSCVAEQLFPLYYMLCGNFVTIAASHVSCGS